MGNKLRQADGALWATVDALTLIFFIIVPVAALVGGGVWLFLTR